jgi:predicted dehydrogenase
MGRRHARNVAALWPRARLVAVADINAETARSVASELECDWYGDAFEMVARAEVEAIVIVTGHATHAPLVIAAAEQGKPVLVEKPLALTVDEARAAVQAARRAGIFLQVGFMRRYDPAYRRAFEAVERGELGKPVLYSGISRDARPPPRSYFSGAGSGGLFIDSGIHDLDLARWIMCDEVTTVWASGALVACHDLADVQPIDAGVITLGFRGGALGTIQLYRNAVYGYDIRTEIIGTEGSAMVGDRRLYPVEVLHADAIGHTMAHHWLERFAEAYALEMADWVERVTGGEEPAVSADDGIRAVELAVAAEESRVTGRTVTV